MATACRIVRAAPPSASRSGAPRINCWIGGQYADDGSKNDREKALKTYGDVTLVGVHTCAHCMPYENDLHVFIARDRKVPIEDAWPTYKHFQ